MEIAHPAALLSWGLHLNSFFICVNRNSLPFFGIVRIARGMPAHFDQLVFNPPRILGRVLIHGARNQENKIVKRA